MLSFLNRRKNKSDIEYIENFVGGNTDQSFEPINEMFCHNNIILTPIDKSYLIEKNDNDKMKNSIIPKYLLRKTTAKFRFTLTI